MEKFRNYVGLVLCLCIVTTVSTAQRKVETVAEKVMLFIDGAQVPVLNGWTSRLAIRLYCLPVFHLISMPGVCR